MSVAFSSLWIILPDFIFFVDTVAEGTGTSAEVNCLPLNGNIDKNIHYMLLATVPLLLLKNIFSSLIWVYVTHFSFTWLFNIAHTRYSILGVDFFEISFSS